LPASGQSDSREIILSERTGSHVRTGPVVDPRRTTRTLLRNRSDNRKLGFDGTHGAQVGSADGGQSASTRRAGRIFHTYLLQSLWDIPFRWKMRSVRLEVFELSANSLSQRAEQ